MYIQAPPTKNCMSAKFYGVIILRIAAIIRNVWKGSSTPDCEKLFKDVPVLHKRRKIILPVGARVGKIIDKHK